MERAEIQFITDHIDGLIQFTSCNTSLIAKLQQRHLLTDDEIGTLEYEHRAPKAKTKYLYDTLKTKKGAFEQLKVVLEECLQTGASEILKKYVPGQSEGPSASQRKLTDNIIGNAAGLLSKSSSVWSKWTQVSAKLGIAPVDVNDLKQQKTLGTKTFYDVYSESLHLWQSQNPMAATLENLVVHLKACDLNNEAGQVDKLT